MSPMTRFTQSFFGLCLLVSMASRARSQSYFPHLKFSDSVVWGEGGEWAHAPSSGDRNITVVLPDGTRKTIPPPSGRSTNALGFRNQAFWMTNHEGEGPGAKDILLRWDLQAKPSKWEVVGDIDGSRGLPSILIPLDRPDRYLGVGFPLLGFADKENASFAAIFKEKDGRLSFEDFVAMPYGSDENICRSSPRPPLPPVAGQPQPEKPQERYACEGRIPALVPTLWTPAQLKDYLVMAATQTGVLWIISLEDGRCKRVIDLGDMGEKLQKAELLEHFLLAMQPTSDQRLLVATCDPVLLRFAEGLYLPPESSLEARKKARKDFLTTAADFRTPVWLSIDPGDSWNITKVDPPLGLPQHAWDNNMLQRFHFIFDPKGNVVSNMQGSPWESVLDDHAIGTMKEKKPLPESKKPEQPQVKTPATPTKEAPKAAPVLKGATPPKPVELEGGSGATAPTAKQ